MESSKIYMANFFLRMLLDGLGYNFFIGQAAAANRQTLN